MFNEEVLAKLELKLIQLRWPGPLNTESYKHLQLIRDWLQERDINSSCFVWDNTGQYLPSGIMLELDDATAFLLRF